ncbi:MAG: phytanoyl-CoA dioxygenase family protein [Candidatus Poribacteria bacterium]|nr:phytanoyl-CoA dioxygenase family protein [Candidatus Poribacteria bacterium]
MNEIANRVFAPEAGEDISDRHTFGIVHWGEPFKKLIDHPKVVPYLVELMGPKFRLDHDYCIFMNEGDTAGGLHGGNGIAGDHWYKYRDGVMRNGLSVVTYFLTDAAEGDGGFGCVPASHKSNFLSCLPPDVRRFERPTHYVVQPAVEAGDALFFTEALVHGTVPWRAKHERRALLYKYSPGHSAWMGSYYDLSKFGELTDQQKRILMPPSIGRRPDVVQEE